MCLEWYCAPFVLKVVESTISFFSFLLVINFYFFKTTHTHNMTGTAAHVRHSLCTASSSSSSSSSLKKSRCSQYHHHQYYRQQGREGKEGVNNRKKRMALLSLVETSLLVSSQSSMVFSAFAAQEAAAAAGSEISPFAGVVDIAALGLLAVFAYLGNKKSSENVQSERQKTITNMPSRRNRTPPPKKWY